MFLFLFFIWTTIGPFSGIKNIIHSLLVITNYYLSNSQYLFWKRTKLSTVNFINVLWAAFSNADPKSAKKTDNLTVFFALLESARLNAARKTLTKLTPGVLFSDIFKGFFVSLHNFYLTAVTFHSVPYIKEMEGGQSGRTREKVFCCPYFHSII